jgi:AcrR family transcriptional regulator
MLNNMATRAATGKTKRGPRPAARDSFTRLAPDARRAQILEAAEHFFATRPNAGFSVAEVATRAEVTPGLVYHYYETKEKLIAAVCDLRAQEMLAAILVFDLRGPLELIEHGVRGYLDFVEAHKRVYLNLFKSSMAAQPEIVRIVEQAREAIIEHFASALSINLAQAPMFRLALRGFIGFTEFVVLDWLEHRAVPRAEIEKLCFQAIGGTLGVGLPDDFDTSAFKAAYRAHFGF